MATDNAYLRGVRLPTRRAHVARVAMLLALAGLMLLVIYALLDSGDGPPVDGFLYVCVLTVVLSFGLFVARNARGKIALARVDDRVVAEALLLRDDFDKAVPLLQRALGAARGPWRQANVLLLLGRCADGRGDFAEAADIYGRAEELLPNRRAVAYAQLAPLLAARRAFSLAAVGRLDEATAAIARTGGRDAYPGTRALAARAQALVLSRRSEHEALCKLSDAARGVVKSSLAYRDRTLVRVLTGNAQRGLAGALRGAAPPRLGLDAETRRWIARAAPEVAPFLEEVS